MDEYEEDNSNAHSSGKKTVQKLVGIAEWVACQTAEQEVSSSNPGIPPLLKHACGEGDWCH